MVHAVHVQTYTSDIPDVSKIDNHADPIHFVNQLPAKGADAAPDRGRFSKGALQQRGIRKLVVAVVRQGRIPHAEVAEHAQVAGLVSNLVEAFNAQRGDQLPGSERVNGVGAVNVMSKVIRVSGEQPLHNVNLLQRELQTCRDEKRTPCVNTMLDEDGQTLSLTVSVVAIRKVGAVYRTWRIHAPKGTSGATSPQPREVDVALERAVLKWAGEAVTLEMVPVWTAEHKREVDVTIWRGGVCQRPGSAKGRVIDRVKWLD